MTVLADAVTVPLLSIPAVQVVLRGPDFLCFLERPKTGRVLGRVLEFQSEERNAGKRDWRDLRERLLSLKTKDSRAIAAWLRDAGYVVKDIVLPEILPWLDACKDAIDWMMGLERQDFIAAVKAARKYGDRILSHAGRTEFMDAVRAPIQIDAVTLQRFLSGFGSSPSLHAFLFWDDQGEAVVSVHVDTPMAALVLSVHVERSFTEHRWQHCLNCGKRFRQKKTTDLYCVKKCRNFFITTRRRKKVRQLQLGADAWDAMPAPKKKGLTRVEWVLQWARRRLPEVPIELEFAKNNLRKEKP
jgi:hypothetical protein